jgi:hypothetical protein
MKPDFLSTSGKRRGARKGGRPRGGALVKAGASIDLRNKHLKIDQRKLDLARRHFGVATEQEAIDLALAAFAEEQVVNQALRDAQGKIEFDESFLQEQLAKG